MWKIDPQVHIGNQQVFHDLDGSGDTIPTATAIIRDTCNYIVSKNI